MKDTRKAIAEFWRWFQLHRGNFDAITGAAAPFWDTALGELQRLDKRLRFELSEPMGNTREFIFTVEGHKEAFPLVDNIVVNAPTIPGWHFIALKPPMGFDFKTTYEGINFDPHSMWFLPLESESNAQDLGLRVGVPNFNAAIMRQARNAVLIILDTALGERAAALDIQYLEVAHLPDSPDSSGYIELCELPSY
ncbi:MAG: hypothetical protein K8T91_09045, partial [Planctomycetes bacterium]|nr:hypothetical protein [Planctomycetota bacterium]